MNFSNMAARAFAAGVLIAIFSHAAAQQAFPSKPIRFIVPYAPGSTLDVLGRMVGQKLTESWGQPVIVDTRPGGNTLIGIKVLLSSLPDGHTLTLNSSSFTLIPQLLVPLPYDPIKDFAPVATISRNELVLVVNASVSANTLQELIALLRSQPGKFNYASTGVGTGGHVAGELFNIMAAVKMVHVPYKGGVPALTDLIGGRVQLFIYTPINCIPHIKAGRIKAIAISGESRLPAISQVPTFTEAGLPGFDVKTWQGVLAPAGTPKAVVDKLSAEIGRILALPDVTEKLTSQGLSPFVSSPEQYAALIRADIARLAKVVKTANIRLEN